MEIPQATLLRIFAKLTTAIYARPYLLSPPGWFALGVLTLVCVVAATLLSVPLGLVPLLLAATGALCCLIGVRGWRLKRSHVPVVVLSLFKGQSSAGNDFAPTHIQALKRKLERRFESAVRVLLLNTSIGQASAQLVRSNLGALMVVYGTTDVSGAHALLETAFGYKRGDRPMSMAVDRDSMLLDGPVLRRRERRRLRRFAPEEIREGSIPVEQFVALDVSVKSFVKIEEATDLLLTDREWQQSGIVPVPRISGACERISDDLDSLRIEQATVRRLQAGKHPNAVTGPLFAEARRGVGGRLLWIWIEMQLSTA